MILQQINYILLYNKLVLANGAQNFKNYHKINMQLVQNYSCMTIDQLT